jgi:ketosteroid isomerase-like protein
VDGTRTNTSPESEEKEDVQSATDPMATVRKFVDAFNKGDVKVMAETCAVPMSILDGLPPHVWHGPTACEDWYRDVMAAGEHEGPTGYAVSIGKPWHFDVRGNFAYVVVPAAMTFTVHGNKATQSGSVFTLALREHPAGWQIAAWAWAKGTK